MTRHLLFLLAAMAFAQPKYSNLEIIPTTTDSATGTLKWLEKRANGTHSFSWSSSDALAASVAMKWPNDGAAGFLYSDGAGNTSWTGAGTCGVDCMTLTTNQTAAGIKTFTNGIIMNGTSYVPTSQFLQVGSAGGVGCLYSGGNITCTNGAGVQRVLIDQASGGSTVSGLIRTFNATDTISSIDLNGIFSAVAFTVGTYASKITIINAAGLVTPVSFQLTTGAVNNYCLVSDAAGVGTWQACSAGGSFITTNTTQTGLTGDKTTAGVWTHNASILAGAANSFDFGTNATPFRVGYIQTVNAEFLEVADVTRSAFWRMKYGSTANSIALDSGSGAQRELDVQVFSATDTQWIFRGTLIAGSIGGANGDVGTTGSKWRDGYFSGTMNAVTFAGTNYTGNNIILSGVGPFLDIGSARMTLNATVFRFLDPTLANAQVFISSGGSLGSGIVATGSNAGTFHNRLDSNGILTNVNYSVGTVGSSTVVIGPGRDAFFTTLQVSAGATVGYVLTSDAFGNASWQAPAAGSFVTTNTNQTGLTGTKSWTNTHTFVGGVTIQATSTARDWLPEADAAYGNGSNAFRWKDGYYSGIFLIGSNALGVRMETSSGISTWYNGSNVQRVQISQAGGGTTVSGSVSVSNASGVTSSINNLGINTTVAYLVNGTEVISSARLGTFAGLLPAADATYSLGAFGSRWVDGRFTGIVFAGTLAVTGGGSFGTSLSVTGAASVANLVINTGAVTVGYCWTATTTGGNGSWQACGSGSFITTNSAQTGMSGNKDTTGTWTWGSVGALSTDITSAGLLTIRNGSGVQRVQLSQGGGVSTVSGSVTTSNASGVTNSMNTNGFDTNIGYRVNGSTGLNTTITVKNSAGSNCTITFTLGLPTASTC